jgi:hemerythrin-like domain-containing protein
MQESDPMTTTGDRLTLEHRELDELLGRFLGAVHAGANEAARDAISQFDEELRRHMAFEEEHVLPAPAGHKLAPGEGETAEAALSRELRVEHVQIRELSGMMRRLVEEQDDLDAARRLFPNLARRWDAHTTREEAALETLSTQPR